MIPTVGKLSPLSRKLFNSLLFEGGRQYRLRQESGLPMLAEESFEAKLSDLVAYLPGDASSWSTSAKTYLHEMVSTLVEWESIDRHSKVEEWGEMPLLSISKIIKKGGNLYVQWAFPPEVLIALKDPAFYTKLNLESVGKLRTYAAIALYEICSRYRTNPSGVTCVQSPEWWVEALSARSIRASSGRSRRKSSSVLEDSKPKREWRKVKCESVLDAINEINEKTDLHVELIEKKTGKAVSAVQFSVQRKRAQQVHKTSLPLDVIEKGIGLGIHPNELSGFVRGVKGGVTIVNAALDKLDNRLKREDLPQVDNRLAYARTIANEIDDFVEATHEKKPQSSKDTRVILDRAVDIIETPESRARRDVEALPREKQVKLVKHAFESMKSKGLATASVTQAYARYMSGGAMAGVLLAEAIRQYVSELKSKER